MNTDSPAGSTNAMRRKLLPLSIGTFAIGTDAFVIAGILPSVAHSLQVSVAAAGQMVTVFAITYALGAPVLSAALSHLPRRQVLLTALTVFVLANLLSAVAPVFAVLALSRVVAALGAGLFTPNAAATAAMSVPAQQRGRALAMVLIGLNVANVLGVPIGTLIGVAFTWRLSFVLVAFLGVLALVGVAVFLRDLPPPMQVSLKRRVAVLGNTRVVLVLLSAVAGSTAGYGFYTYLAPELSTFGGISQAALAPLFIVNGIVGIIGGQLGGRFADRFPIFVVAVAGFTAIAVTMFLAPLLGMTYVGAVVLIVLFALTTTVVYVPVQHRLTGLAPTAATEVLALNSSALYIGISLAGVVGGALLASVGATAIPLACGVFAVLGLLLYASSHVRERQAAEAAAKGGQA
ncbi:MAG TPA: MFS transporter [Candidatus Dormibacteraeota bacterium]|nr:MFS transporter [Candidatus Dormibacteraeota bacterium]